MDAGKILIIAGGLLILMGLMMNGLLGPLGRLPGDIIVERPNMTLYVPITTMIILSLLISVLIWIFTR